MKRGGQIKLLQRQKSDKVKLTGFTLLEVLIAVGILFVVGSAVVSLSNSLIQGTIASSDSTIVNLWAVEGLELTTKSRDDNIRQPTRLASGEPGVWLSAAQSPDQYGWHTLVKNGDRWDLQRLDLPLALETAAAYQSTQAESKQSGGLTAKRLICLEAVGAVSTASNSELRCNTTANGEAVSDGSRLNLTACESSDSYCRATSESLSKNTLVPVVIPAGNAVKARAVVVWPHRASYRSAGMATFITNWKGYDQ